MSENSKKPRKKLCIVATVPFVLRWFMTPHINMLSRNYDVTLISSGKAEDLAGLLSEQVSFVPLQIERKISPLRDLVALVSLWRLFRKERFDSVHSIMPKSGLLAMVAARFSGVPHRLHTFTGQVWANTQGIRRALLKLLDKLLVANATRVLADSHSQRAFLMENGIGTTRGITVLADGSVAGVDLNRFCFNSSVRTRVRENLNIPADAFVFLFLGRLSKDKGLRDLSRAFNAIAPVAIDTHILVVGPDEDGLDAEFGVLAQQFPGRVHRVGFTNRPEEYMSASDVLCLPSYREGFGMVIIEAAAVGLPAIASRVYGITDAVEDGVTGLLHQPGNVEELASSMRRVVFDLTFRRQMGEAARATVESKFSQARVAQALADFYRDMFAQSSRS